jgi:alkylhydroperoxidase family enzyme
LYQALLNSAPIASGWEKFLTAVRKHTTVPPALRELVILRIAVLNRAAFEFDEHVLARAGGGRLGRQDGSREALAPGLTEDAGESADPSRKTIDWRSSSPMQ